MDSDVLVGRPWLRTAVAELTVQALTGHEALSTPFSFTLTAWAPIGLEPAALLGMPAQFGFCGADGPRRELCALISSIETLGQHREGQSKLSLTLTPRLLWLKRSSNARVLRNLSLPELIEQLLISHGYRPEQIHLHLSHSYPPEPYLLQAHESDFDFLQRLLARAGVFYWFECFESQERIHFSDHNGACPYAAQGVLHYRPPSGTSRTLAGAAIASFDWLRVEARWQPRRAGVHVLSDPLPPRARVAGDMEGDVRFAAAPATFDAAAAQAALEDERQAVTAHQVLAEGDVAGLQPGQVLSLEAVSFDPQVSGDYLVIAAEHALTEPDDIDGAEPAPYRLKTTLIRRERPYRPPLPPKPKLPLLFPARIESTARYSELDERGRYRLRAQFEQSAHRRAEATPPIPKLAPLGGPATEQAQGLHFPLQEGAEVLVTCLNEDPERPLILGFAPSAQQPGPVVGENRVQNRLTTPSGNEFVLEDTLQKEFIELKSFEGQTLLRLDADTDAPLVQLACQYGGVQMMARQAQRLLVKENLTERIGGQRTQLIEQASRTRTKQGEIHHQAATDARLTAANQALIRSGQDTQLVAGQKLTIDAERDVSITIKGANGLTAQIKNGEVRVQAAKNIRIKGQGGGDIIFEQAGGGFSIKQDGTVRLFGNTVTLKAQGEVALNGPVEYSVPASVQADEVQAKPVKKPKDFGYLNLPSFEQTTGRNNLILRLLFPQGTASGYRFLLQGKNGYRQSKTLEDDLLKDDAYLDLLFEGLDVTSSYTLTMEADGRTTILFQNIPFADLERPEPSHG
jgi:type VI secretion system secreted protein VgrG